MRLLDTSTRKLTETTSKQWRDGDKTYAILSHVWREDEVAYQDVVNGTEHLRSEASQNKLHNACEQARRDGYKYIWIDTCCIDKSSSSELSEAINSMYVWYGDAKECYAFLDDAPDELETAESANAFRRSGWFTRGWTLQELLAPVKVVFFSRNWRPLGERRNVSALLADITGVDQAILSGRLPVHSASLAKRMSWASQRETTRPEDLAYCLMGLFGVNMPMLYGEGAERAFLRLQEEIMKSSDDQSLFAWADRDLGRDPSEASGLLASSPAAFSFSNGMSPYHDWEPREPYMMTNRGLHIRLHLTALGDDVFVAALDCPVPPDYQDSTFLAIYLKRLSSGNNSGDDQGQHYARIRVGKFGSVRERGKLTWIYVRQTQQAPADQGLFPQHVLQLRTGPRTDLYRLERVVANRDVDADAPDPLSLRNAVRSWVPDPYPIAFRMRKAANELTLALIFAREDGERLAVLVGSVSGFQVAFDAVELDHEDDGLTQDTSLKALAACAELSVLGPKETEFHRVHCSATTVIRNAYKYCLIDVDVEVVKRSPREMLAMEAAEMLNHVIGMKPLPEPKPEPEPEPQYEPKLNGRGAGRAFRFGKGAFEKLRKTQA